MRHSDWHPRRETESCQGSLASQSRPASNNPADSPERARVKQASLDRVLLGPELQSAGPDTGGPEARRFFGSSS